MGGRGGVGVGPEHTAPFRAGEATKSSHIEPIRTTPQGQEGVYLTIGAVPDHIASPICAL